MRLFDRPPAETQAVLLGTACVSRKAAPTLATDAGHQSQEVQLASFEESMPAVEVFALVCATGHASSDYPFTSAFYESSAYRVYRKRHFPDMMLPSTMGDLPCVEGSTRGGRHLVLWDARFIAH